MTPAPPLTDVRDNLLDAVERLLARYGYQKTTMDDLAREAGIGKGTIYLYFPSKEEVALCSIDRVVDRLIHRLRRIAHGSECVSARLRRMLVTRVLFRVDSVQAYSQSLDDLFEGLRPAYMVRRDKYFDAEKRVFAGVLRAGKNDRSLELENPSETAHTLLLATNSLIPYSLSVRELGERAAIHKKAGKIADLLLRGLMRHMPA